ncbi:MAG: hypothetical protein KF708_08000 [Pirellulales bacterium]|nr:hypothetical protein [Pirellulales bacterium]
MNQPPKKTPDWMIEPPDWDAYPESVRPVAKLGYAILFPLVACLWLARLALTGVVFLMGACWFYFVLYQAGALPILAVAVVTSVAAAFFVRRRKSEASLLRGRELDRRAPFHTRPNGRSVWTPNNSTRPPSNP